MNVDREALRRRLRALFVDELDEHVAVFNHGLLALEQGADVVDVVNDLFRSAHSLKGAARAADVPPVETLCHRLEDLLSGMRDGTLAPGGNLEPIFAAVDVIAAAGRNLREGGDASGLPVADVLRGLASVAAGASVPPDAPGHRETARPPKAPHQPETARPPKAPHQPETVRPPKAPHQPETVRPPKAPHQPETARPPKAPHQPQTVALSPDVPERPPPAPVATLEATTVRVAVDRLDSILNQVGEVLLAGQRVHALARQLAEVTDTLRTRRAAWGASRAVVTSAGTGRAGGGRAGAMHDGADHVGDGAVQLLNQADAALREVTARLVDLAQTATATDRLLTSTTQGLVQGVRQARMLPVARACESLDRTVRDLARAAEKEVRLEIEGGDVELDRPILEGLREPLLHIVRNAVDHGIETTAARRSAGKDPAGRVTVVARVEGGKVTVTVADDGRGVDGAALRAVAERRGVAVTSDDPAQLAELAFAAGVSTAPIITEVSGRGVGLDAVRARVEALGGSVRLSSAPGEGTRVVLDLPLTLSAVRVLFVEAAGEVFALPSSTILRLVRVASSDVQLVDDRPVVLLDGNAVAVLPLAHALGLDGETRRRPAVEGVVVEAPGGAALLTVDAFGDEEEVVMKGAGERLAGLPTVLGATILTTGRVAMILNPFACARAGLARRVGLPDAGEERERPMRVLLAEDTLTTRALERSILESAGYEVVVAVDGADAWRLLQERGADVIVSDVNMPRMDGLALCEAVRSSSRFRDVPFVLVTSLATEEDRRRGVEAGADAYIVKGDFDQSMLLDAIERLR